MNHRLSIARLRNRYLAPRDHPALDDLRARLDILAARAAAEVCGRRLEQAIDSRDDSLWFIRSVEFDLTLDAGSSAPDEVIRFWGTQLAAGVLRTIARGPDGNHVVRFQNRPHYIAEFVAEAAAGRAWTNWVYRSFDSLRSLPAGAAIREAIIREPQHARAVALRLTETTRWESVLPILSPRDAREILHACSPAPPAASGSGIFVALAQAWRSEPAASPAHTALHLAARTGFTTPAATLEWFTAIVPLLELPLVRHALASCDLPRFIAAIRAAAPPDVAEALLPSPSTPETLEFLQQVAAALPLSGAREEIRTFESPYAAVFLVLPYWEEAVPQEILASPMLRLLLAAEILGCRHAAAFWLDEALLLAIGIQAVDPADLTVSDATAEMLAAAAAAVFRAFTSRLIGFHSSSPAFLRTNFLTGRGIVRSTPFLIEAELPPVPLRVVLRFAGIDRKSYEVPWLEEVTIRLRLPEE